MTGALVEALGEPLVEALCLAALAPSGHNAQPWLVLVHSARHWSLALAPDRRLPIVDPADQEALVSLGAFLENLVVAAADLGVDVRVEGFGERPDDAEVVRLGLAPGATPFPRMTGALVSRRTLRTAFREDPLSPADLATLSEGLPGLTWVPGGSPEADRIRDLVAGAVRHQVTRDDAQAEFAEWLRWSGDDAEAHRDGLTTASLGLAGLAGWYAKRFFDHDSALSGTFRRHSASRAARMAAACGGWMLVSAMAPGVAGSVEAGRAFQRLFLRARGLGIGVHPMSQPLEEPGWRGELESALAIAGYPRMLLRLGYVDDYPPPVSPRLPPTAFTRVLFSTPDSSRRPEP
jgi:nitroreductase